MKRVSFLLIALMGLLAAPQLVHAQDDIYYSPGNDTYNSPDYTTTDRYTDGNGDTYVTNNNYYYDNDDEYVFYDDFAYSSRIRRFNRPASHAYYSPYYVDRYFYDFDPFLMGNTIYVNNWYPSYERTRMRYSFYGPGYTPWYLNRGLVSINIGNPWGFRSRRWAYNTWANSNYWANNNYGGYYNTFYSNSYYFNGFNTYRFNNGCPTAFVNNNYYFNDNGRDRNRENFEYAPRGGRGSGYGGGTTHGIIRTSDIGPQTSVGANNIYNPRGGGENGDSKDRGKVNDSGRSTTPTIIEYPTRTLSTSEAPAATSGRTTTDRPTNAGSSSRGVDTPRDNNRYGNARPAPNTSKPSRTRTNEYSKPTKNNRSIFGGRSNDSKPSRSSKSYDSKSNRSSKSYSSKPSRSSKSYNSKPNRSSRSYESKPSRSPKSYDSGRSSRSSSNRSYSSPSRSSSSKSYSGGNRGRSSSSSKRGGF